MAATLIDGKAIAASIREEVRKETAVLRASRGTVPGLAFILVGEDPASQSYVRMKGKACAEVGFYSVTEHLPADTPFSKLLALIEAFNTDPRIHGILVQLPLPRQIDESVVLNAVDFRKDVDGFHPINVGRLVTGQPCLKPATPLGIQELLLRSGNDPAGKHVVVVGRSNIVGKPVANILMQKQAGANAAVTVVHSAVKNISKYTREADILIAAIGKAGFIRGDMIKPGAVVIDVGTNRVSDPSAAGGSKLVGDVDFAAAVNVASAITPVPGGVGPMTIALLLRNTLDAAGGRLYATV
jgi:methylenetetrahydrofolate dehydrogenase (NADP+) / methenyltetrahydrofolate cyclohydrolase